MMKRTVTSSTSAMVPCFSASKLVILQVMTYYNYSINCAKEIMPVFVKAGNNAEPEKT